METLSTKEWVAQAFELAWSAAVFLVSVLQLLSEWQFKHEPGALSKIKKYFHRVIPLASLLMVLDAIDPSATWLYSAEAVMLISDNQYLLVLYLVAYWMHSTISSSSSMLSARSRIPGYFRLILGMLVLCSFFIVNLVVVVSFAQGKSASWISGVVAAWASIALTIILVMINVCITLLRNRVYSLSEGYELESDSSHQVVLVQKLLSRLKWIQLIMCILLIPAVVIAVFVCIRRLHFSDAELSVSSDPYAIDYAYSWSSLVTYFVGAFILSLAIRLTWIPINLCCWCKEAVVPDEFDMIAGLNDDLNRSQALIEPEDSTDTHSRSHFVVKTRLSHSPFHNTSSERLLDSPWAYGGLTWEEEPDMPTGSQKLTPLGVL